MQKTTIIAFAAAASAFANAALAFAQEVAGETATVEPSASAAPAEDAPKATRGRKPAAEKPAPVETAAEVIETAKVEEEEKPAAPPAKTYEDMRQLIKPHVEGGRGESVKKIISSYGVSALKDMDPKNYPAFEKDIAALDY